MCRTILPVTAAGQLLDKPELQPPPALAITKELIEMYGGVLSIESKVDVGTTVTVRLPYNAYEHIKALKKKA